MRLAIGHQRIQLLLFLQVDFVHFFPFSLSGVGFRMALKNSHTKRPAQTKSVPTNSTLAIISFSRSFSIGASAHINTPIKRKSAIPFSALILPRTSWTKRSNASAACLSLARAFSSLWEWSAHRLSLSHVSRLSTSFSASTNSWLGELLSESRADVERVGFAVHREKKAYWQSRVKALYLSKYINELRRSLCR